MPQRDWLVLAVRRGFRFTIWRFIRGRGARRWTGRGWNGWGFRRLRDHQERRQDTRIIPPTPRSWRLRGSL